MRHEPAPHIGLTCPRCKRSIADARLQAPWCECGWNRRGRGLAAAVGLASILALLVLAGVAFQRLGAVASSARANLAPAVARPAAEPAHGLAAVPDPARPRHDSAAPAPRPTLAANDFLNLARKLVADGSLAEAAGVYRKAIELQPALAEARFELGLLCADLADFPCALAQLAKVHALRQDDPEILEHLASIANEAGQTAPALDALRKLQRLEPRNPRPAFELARTLEAGGRRDDAAAAYRSFLGRFPHDASAADARRRLDALARPARPAPPERRGHSVPIQRSGSAILVDGQVEGARGVRFLLDTGSTLTIISSQLARELGINPASRGHERVRLETANGPIEAPIIQLKSLRLGKVVVRDVRAAVFDVKAVDPIDGLLGLSFLDRFRFTIDASKGVLFLEPR